MRAKRLGFILLSVLLLMLPCREVFASADYKISYDITRFKVTKEDIIFEGWSFLDHMDNYGGKNMRTFIAAYVGDWTYGNGLSKCGKSSNCTYKEAETDTDTSKAGSHRYDLYFIRCVVGACNNSNRVKAATSLKNGTKEFQDNSCTGANYGFSASHCTYRNVGFKLSLNISELINKLKLTSDNKNETVKFRIVTRTYYGNKKKKGKYIIGKDSTSNDYSYHTDSSDIGVIKNSCDTVFSKDCKKGKAKTYNTTVKSNGKKVKRSIVVGGLNNTVLFTAGSASGYYGSSGPSSGIRQGKIFAIDKKYTIMETGSVKKYSNWKDDKKGSFWGRLFKIKRENDVGYAWSAWVKASGALRLKITDKDIPTHVNPCSEKENLCIGSGCVYSSQENKCAISHTTPTDSPNYLCKGDITKNTCNNADYEISCIKTLSDTYYYRMSVSDVEKYFKNVTLLFNGGYDIKKRGKYYYFPIKFYANVKYQQNASLKLTFKNKAGDTYTTKPFTVKSGLSFTYSFDYNVTSSWNFNGKYVVNSTNNTTKNNTYDDKISVDVEENNESTSQDFFVSLTTDDDLYKKNDNGSFSKYGKYGVSLYEDLAVSQAKKFASDIDEDYNIVEFDDSNDANSSSKNADAGTFSCGNYSVSKKNWNAGVERSVICNYKINSAYLDNKGNGNFIYSENDGYSKVNNGGWYYIPLNLKTGERFKIQTNAYSLSLVDGIYFEYTPLCEVIAENEIDTVNYRTIDTDSTGDELEKELTATNWKEYINSKGLSRITNSFEKVSYQTKNLKKISYDTSKYGNYYSYDDMDIEKNGTSKFITDNINSIFTRINRKHCREDEWNTTCDK